MRGFFLRGHFDCSRAISAGERAKSGRADEKRADGARDKKKWVAPVSRCAKTIRNARAVPVLSLNGERRAGRPADKQLRPGLSINGL